MTYVIDICRLLLACYIIFVKGLYYTIQQTVLIVDY